MPKIKLLYLILIIFLMSGSLECPAASGIKVSAKVDKTNISLDEFVQFIITIEGASDSSKNPKIKLPKLQDNFDIVATASSNNISLMGGKMKISWQLQYTLSPKKEGEIKIDSAEITFEGMVYKTKELVITVSPAKSPQKIPKQEAPPKQVPWSEDSGISI